MNGISDYHSYLLRWVLLDVKRTTLSLLDDGQLLPIRPFLYLPRERFSFSLFLYMLTTVLRFQT